MSTNPDSALGTNGAYGGRTSVNAFNDVLQSFNGSGILSGFTCAPYSGMTVSVGGDSGVRDVAIAEDPYGNRTTINNISGSIVNVTVNAASSTSPRYTSIVAYVNSPATVSDTTLDNPGAVGIIAVDGTAASIPVEPTDSIIRTAITSDGGTGTTAYYAVLANIYVATSITTITRDYITQEGLYVDSDVLALCYGSSIKEVSSSSTTTLATFTVERAGAYFMYLDGWVNRNGASTTNNLYPKAEIISGTITLASSQVQLTSTSDYAQIDLDACTVTYCSEGDEIEFQYYCADSTPVYKYNYGWFRIGR